MHSVQVVVEDVLQEVVLSKLIDIYRKDISLIGVSGKRGNEYIKQSINAFNKASKFLPHIVITDLDRTNCAPELISKWINFPIHKNMLFRVAEKEIDAWLLSDRKNFANFIGVTMSKIPYNTQEIPDPKQFIINLAKKSRKKLMKDIIPEGNATQGPGYNPILQNFIVNYWEPEQARNSNLSLKKAIVRLQTYLK